MSYPIKYPTPQGANIQIFQGGNAVIAGHNKGREWVKPQGASFVWFTLIGAGGGTDTTGTQNVGGGSGGVSNFMCPAFLIPDVLQVLVGRGTINNGEGTTVYYQQKDGSGYTIVTANGGNSGTSGGGAASLASAEAIAAMGFFQGVAGHAGASGARSVSGGTFLSGGSFGGSVTSNYGYVNTGFPGFFQMQPIIVGGGGTSVGNGIGGIGCGGGGSSATGIGGDGLVVIITW